MLKTYLYLPTELNEKLETAAKIQKKSKAEIIRLALERSMTSFKEESNASALVFGKIAKIGIKHNPDSRSDLSENIDRFLWDED